MSVRRTAVCAALWAGAFLVPLGVGAQRLAGDGFLFGAPGASLTLRLGYAQPLAGSEVFAFSNENLTLGRSDYAGGALSGDFAWFVAERVALQISAGYSRRTVGSEFRDWVDTDDLPIEQTTEFSRVPVMVGLRYYLVPPGRTLGRLAWVPARFAPYVSAGVGRVRYRFHQFGDFVDYQTLDVFDTDLESSGWTTAGYGAAGLDYAMSARVGLVSEARYDRAYARMSSDFEGFDRIDLSGLSATIGLSFRF